MIYAKIGVNEDSSLYVCASVIPGVNPEPGVMQAYNVPHHRWLKIVNGAIAIVDPSAEDLLAAKENAKQLVNSKYSAMMAQVTSGYPQDEIFSWDKQESEARNGVTTPFIDALAAARGIDRTELISRILAKANAFTYVSATLTGIRQKLEDEIDAATTKEDVEAIAWP